MKIRELITVLSKFDPELELTISDGFGYHFYHTNAFALHRPKKMVKKVP